MYRFMMIVSICVGLLFAVTFIAMKSGSDANVADHQAQVAAVEAEIMQALRAGDNTRVQQARDRLFELYPRSDVEANQIYDHCLQRFNWERSGQH